MVEIARTLKALKISIGKLNYYYLSEKSKQPRFPFFQSFEGEGITYQKEIKMHVFRATRDRDQQNVIVKFTDKYCIDAHNILAAAKFTPKLLYGKNVTKRFMMVVTNQQLTY